MANYDRLASVTIQLRTARLTGTNFGLPIIIGETSAFSDRIIEVTDPDELAKKGVSSTDPLYVMVNTALAQKAYGGINSVLVGRKGKDETYPDAVAACRAKNATFRTLLSTTRDYDSVIALAEWCESHGVIFVTASADAQCADPTSSTDILAKLKKYPHTNLVYDPKALSQYSDAALAGRCLSQPIRAPWNNRRIAGVDPLADETAAKAAIAKGAYTIEEFSSGAGTSSVMLSQGGTTASGEWTDIIRGRDYAEEYIQHQVAQFEIDNDIPYNDAGIQCYVSVLDAALKYLQQIGIIDEDAVKEDGSISRGYVIKYPRRSEISANVVATRKLNDITFEGRLKGAISSSSFNGTLSYSTDI